MQHLNETTKRFIDSCSENNSLERIRHIQQDLWIGYKDALQVLDKMDEMILHPRNHRMKSMLVIGTTNNGKTAILNRFKEMHRHHIGEDMELNYPSIFLQMPYNVDERSFLNSILEAMYQPFKYNGRVENTLRSALQSMAALQVKLLVIDEVQHIIGMNYKKQRVFLHMLKYISNHLRLPMVCFGTEEALNVFSSDPQLHNRFRQMVLPQWIANNDFRRLLISFEQVLPLLKPSGLDSKELAFQIYQKTNGTIGEISDVLKLSAIEAIKSGTECISKETIEKIDFISGKGLQGELAA